MAGPWLIRRVSVPRLPAQAVFLAGWGWGVAAALQGSPHDRDVLWKPGL